MTGIYIHVPFCKRKCPYCAFYSKVFDCELKDGYVKGLIRDISSFKGGKTAADTVYFGGGTPSLLEPEDVGSILRAVSESFELAADCEITMEMNPSSVSPEKLSKYRSLGVNRVSFGVQSAIDSELKSLGRLHDFETASRAVRDAKAAGFYNISCDLMIGTPGQTVETMILSCEKLIELDIPHISCYMLKIEEGTAFDCDAVRNASADDDTVSEMYLDLCRRLNSAGYERYEISNFAKPGFRSRHNMKYWRLEDYIGFGPSAHSCFGGKRLYQQDDLEAFVSGRSSIAVEDDSPDFSEEYIMLGLRISDGVSIRRVSELGGDAERVKTAIRPFVSGGLMELDGDVVRLTDRGALVSNSLILETILAAFGENK